MVKEIGSSHELPGICFNGGEDSGKVFGLAPAITELTATFSTVIIPPRGIILPSTSLRSRVVAASISSTSSGSGIISGKPSPKPSSIAMLLNSCAALTSSGALIVRVGAVGSPEVQPAICAGVIAGGFFSADASLPVRAFSICFITAAYFFVDLLKASSR